MRLFRPVCSVNCRCSFFLRRYRTELLYIDSSIVSFRSSASIQLSSVLFFSLGVDVVILCGLLLLKSTLRNVVLVLSWGSFNSSCSFAARALSYLRTVLTGVALVSNVSAVPLLLPLCVSVVCRIAARLAICCPAPNGYIALLSAFVAGGWWIVRNSTAPSSQTAIVTWIMTLIAAVSFMAVQPICIHHRNH